MGGTSYDVCLIRDGRPELTSDWNWRHRYCIALPMVDIHAIGAGGGSIARVDGGGLHVGPESAGSEPGPVCYGRGGTRADRHRRRPRARPPRPDRRSGAVAARSTSTRRTRRSARLGERARAATPRRPPSRSCALVDAHMTDAVRRVLCARRRRPAPRSTSCAFGGMGAVHATTQAAALGMRRVVVPRAAPGFSALGLVSADHVVDATRAHLADWRKRRPRPAQRARRRARESPRARSSSAAGVPDERVRLEWLLNLVYPGQTFDNALPLDAGAGQRDRRGRRQGVRRGVPPPERRGPAHRGALAGADGARDPTRRDRARRPADARRAARPCPPQPSRCRHAASYLGNDWHEAAVYDGDALAAGARSCRAPRSSRTRSRP